MADFGALVPLPEPVADPELPLDCAEATAAIPKSNTVDIITRFIILHLGNVGTNGGPKRTEEQMNKDFRMSK